MLLSNVTAHGSACTALLSLKIPVLPDPKSPIKVFPVDSRCMTCPAPVPYPPGEPKEVLALPLLVDAFVKAAAVTEDREKRLFKGDLHFLASVFANVSTVGAVRTRFVRRCSRSGRFRPDVHSFSHQDRLTHTTRMSIWNFHCRRSLPSPNTRTRSGAVALHPQSSL